MQRVFKEQAKRVLQLQLGQEETKYSNCGVAGHNRHQYPSR